MYISSDSLKPLNVKETLPARSTPRTPPMNAEVDQAYLECSAVKSFVIAIAEGDYSGEDNKPLCGLG